MLHIIIIIIIIIIILLDLLAKFRPRTINKLSEGDSDAKGYILLLTKLIHPPQNVEQDYNTELDRHMYAEPMK